MTPPPITHPLRMRIAAIAAPAIIQQNASLQSEVDRLNAALAEAKRPSDPDLFCSFCGKSHRAVERLIAGPSTFICNECVALCVDVLFGGKKPSEAAE